MSAGILVFMLIDGLTSGGILAWWLLLLLAAIAVTQAVLLWLRPPLVREDTLRAVKVRPPRPAARQRTLMDEVALLGPAMPDELESGPRPTRIREDRPKSIHGTVEPPSIHRVGGVEHSDPHVAPASPGFQAGARFAGLHRTDPHESHDEHDAPPDLAEDKEVCGAMTQAGTPCQNKPRAGSAWCAQHGRPKRKASGPWG